MKGAVKYQLITKYLLLCAGTLHMFIHVTDEISDEILCNSLVCFFS